MDIRFSRLEERGRLTRFIHEHWKADHPLVLDPALMDWQYRNEQAGHDHFVVAVQPSGELEGVLGFIPTSQFDPSLTVNPDIWLSIWKVKEGSRSAGLGMQLLSYLMSEVNPRSIAALGISEVARSIYRLMGYTTGKLRHFYMLHPNLRSFQLASGISDEDRRSMQNESSQERVQLIRCEESSFLSGVDHGLVATTGAIPHKTRTYFRQRYFRHPSYRYDTYAIVREEAPQGFIVMRTAKHQTSRAIRIVDYIGREEAWIGLGPCLQQLLLDSGAEYVDFYQHGMQEQIIRQAGFQKRDGDRSVIIPNYFEPFSQENVELEFAYKQSSDRPYYLFKGDSDQDRPNQIGR
ncbi:hypothetical protein [Marinicrinis sediminis]|uniref:GNAT family N-acetyltransferase n=1 Tax=Marinicrinis sediminis TaxID=1652465 RepID=A0ABW5R773_9BACL